MRTFVAIELDDLCKDKLERAIDALRPAGGSVKWVRRDALHLTIKFIGELETAELPAAISAIESASSAAPPFTMRVAGLSGFPPRGRIRVVHVEVEENSGALASLQKGVDQGLAQAAGVKPEQRRFVPHITLGRAKRQGRPPSLEDLSAALTDQDFGSVEVDSLVLIKSDLTPQGPIYTLVHQFALKGQQDQKTGTA